MTAAPGDTLVAPPLAMFFEDHFRTNQRTRNHPPDPRETSPLSASGSDDRSTLKMHGYHVPSAGTVETLESFHHRITCRNLVI